MVEESAKENHEVKTEIRYLFVNFSVVAILFMEIFFPMSAVQYWYQST